jgi:hypothetical protein
MEFGAQEISEDSRSWADIAEAEEAAKKLQRRDARRRSKTKINESKIGREIFVGGIVSLRVIEDKLRCVIET